MRYPIRLAASAAAAALVAGLAGPAIAGERLTGEAKLAKILEGRVAGEPQSCITTFANTDSVVIDGTALVYGRGKTVWVNRPVNPKSLNRWDALLIRKQASSLCRHDIVTTFDASTGMYTGNVFLTEFVPYTRAD
ncbi:hypothetical protein N0B51_13465 [Tsuneonella sp. YG55]|uniref:Uncharacterized protein n=1 Tax=Tsuneonella litorea TaxID=2976475 RepID=A0A9X2W365_9SPHN|nr:hypothetical protein [Tsuneonella litorea]MCT2559986.1 hypothetical protein [Tsuneonella litorea]